MSCYICRQIVTGYEHFNRNQTSSSRFKSNQCTLWDTDLDALHANEVRISLCFSEHNLTFYIVLALSLRETNNLFHS